MRLCISKSSHKGFLKELVALAARLIAVLALIHSVKSYSESFKQFDIVCKEQKLK